MKKIIFVIAFFFSVCVLTQGILHAEQTAISQSPIEGNTMIGEDPYQRREVARHPELRKRLMDRRITDDLNHTIRQKGMERKNTFANASTGDWRIEAVDAPKIYRRIFFKGYRR